MTLPRFKRVVTGHDAQGGSRIDQASEPVPVPLSAVPGTVFHEIWKTHAMPVPVDDDSVDPTRGPLRLTPTSLGSAVRVVDIPPDSVQNEISAADAARAFAEIGVGHGSSGDNDSRHRLMHRTETLDYGILVEGELWLVMDHDEVKLNVGDIVVQRGTNHAWSNRTERMARMVFILLDGRYAPALSEALELKS